MNNRNIPREDLEFIGRNRDGLWVVRETLYPESRGWIEHRFATEAEAVAFARWGSKAPPETR